MVLLFLGHFRLAVQTRIFWTVGDSNCVCMCVSVYVYVYVCVCEYVFEYVCMCVCVCVHRMTMCVCDEQHFDIYELHMI